MVDFGHILFKQFRKNRDRPRAARREILHPRHFDHMTCDLPQCTSVHDANKPVASLCPAARERLRARGRVYDHKRSKTPHRRAVNHTSNLKCKYGMTVEQYDALLVEQDGLCAICRRPESVIQQGTAKKLHVDHDHLTGVVRGLLCAACNKALGLLCDDPAALRNAALYLEDHSHTALREQGSSGAVRRIPQALPPPCNFEAIAKVEIAELGF